MASATQDPVVTALDRLAARLEVIEARLERLDPLLDRYEHFSKKLPIAVEGAVGGAEGLIAQQGGAPLMDRVEIGMELAIKASEPQALATVSKLLDQLEAVEAMTGRLDKLEQLMGVVDALPAEKVAEAGAAAVGSKAFADLLDSGLADERGLALLAATGRAVTAAQGGSIESVGFFGALKAMGDPQVQKAVGLALAVAKHLGSELEKGTAIAKR